MPKQLSDCPLLLLVQHHGRRWIHLKHPANRIFYLKYLGVIPDINLNEKMTRGNEGKITTENSTVDVYVIPTNEELVIARDTRSILEAMQYANL